VVTEVALSIVLLIGAGLMIRSFLNMYGMTAGFGAERFLVMRLELPKEKYANDAARGRFYESLEERLGAVPNARRAAIIKEEQGKVWARVYAKGENRDGDLARNVMAAASAWQVEELHTEEGRLDEVFRGITLPETDKEAKK